jgi:hypothetical protein
MMGRSPILPIAFIEPCPSVVGRVENVLVGLVVGT